MLHRTRIFLAAAGLATVAMIASANAAEIQLLGSTAMREALDELAPLFEKQSGHKVAMSLYPAATLVADGKAEIGVQQIGELLPIPGIVTIGPLPAELQTVIVYGMGRSANARQWDAASALVKFLTSPAVGPMLKKLGLDPA